MVSEWKNKTKHVILVESSSAVTFWFGDFPKKKKYLNKRDEDNPKI